MTVSATGNRFTDAGNGVTVAFTYPRLYLAKSDVVVELIDDATGGVSTQTLNVHYSLSAPGNPAGGTVTMVTAPPAGKTVMRRRRTSRLQSLDLDNVVTLPPRSLEAALDRAFLAIDEIDDKLDRTVRLADSDTSGGTMTFNARDFNGKALGVDVNGVLVPVSTLPPTQVTDAYMAPSISALRAITAAAVTAGSVILWAHTAGGTTGGGVFQHDNADGTTADDGGVTIVDASGRRWKRVIDGPLSPLWFGAKGDMLTDDLSAWNDLVDYAERRIAAGDDNIEVYGAGRTYGLSDTLSCGSATSGLVLAKSNFFALGNAAAWTESDVAVTGYFKKYQTYGTSWITQKPLLRVGTGNPGFVLRDCTLDGNLVAAGVYVRGNNKGRMLDNIGIDNCASYGFLQTGSIKLNDVRIRGSTDVNGPRTAYGAVYDSVDSHWNQVTAQWCHCPLLTTGATLMMVDCDLFNGNDGSPVANPRLWEHRGNTITWVGGRLGNGVIHCWSTDLTIQPTKIGLTAAASITDYFLFYATSASQKITNFGFSVSELPQELRSGAVDMVGFVTPSTFTANTANGSAVLTNVSSVTKLNIGQGVSGTGIPGGATITDIDSVALTVTISANATAPGTGVTVTPAGSWDTNTLAALNSKNGYWQVVPRGVSLIATEDNNVYPQEIINAPGSNALVRAKSGGSAVVPEWGLRNNGAYLGSDTANGLWIGTDGLMRRGNSATAGAPLPYPVFKAADTSRNSAGTGSTLTADPDLVTPSIPVNSKARITYSIPFTTVASAGFKFEFTGPAGTSRITNHRKHVDPTTPGTIVKGFDNAFSSAVTIAGGAGTEGGFVEGEMTVQTGLTAGAITFRWAQATAQAGNTIVHAGARMTFELI